MHVSRFGHCPSGFFFSSRRRHTRCSRDWSSDVCSSDLADILNDVSALTHDPEAMAVAGETGLPVILMHAQGDPRTMNDDPRSEERRVGKECRSRWWPDDEKKKSTWS